MRSLVKALGAIPRGLTIIGVVLVMSMLIMVVMEVILRYLFSSPIPGQTELVRMINTTLVLVLGTTVLLGNNIKVDVVTNLFPKKVQNILFVITCILSVFIFAIIAWQNVESAIFMYTRNIRYSMIRFPQFPFYLMIAIGYAGGVLATIIVLFRLFKKVDIEKETDEAKEAAEIAKAAAEIAESVKEK